MNDIYKEIEQLKEPVYDGLENEYVDEEFIEIKETERIKLDLQYTKLGFENAIDKAYVRRSVFERLQKALEYLPLAYCIKILDAWRPLGLQKELFEKYSENIVKQFNLANMNKEEQDKFISKFVAMPGPDDVPAHTTGGAIDIMLVRNDETEVDMGVGFDEFSDRTYSNSYERIREQEDSIENAQIRMNRRILYNCMTMAGFTNLPSEIWHYDFGNRNWAFYTKKKCLYKRCKDFEEVKHYDN